MYEAEGQLHGAGGCSGRNCDTTHPDYTPQGRKSAPGFHSAAIDPRPCLVLLIQNPERLRRGDLKAPLDAIETIRAKGGKLSWERGPSCGRT